MELVYTDGDRVIGIVEYVGRDDVWRAESIHQPGKPVVFHASEDAVAWVRQLHCEESTGQ